MFPYECTVLLVGSRRISGGSDQMNNIWANMPGGGRQKGDPHKKNTQVIVWYLMSHVSFGVSDLWRANQEQSAGHD